MGNLVENQPEIPENVGKQPEIEESKDITDQEAKEIVEAIKQEPEVVEPVKRDRVSFSEMLRNRRKTKN